MLAQKNKGVYVVVGASKNLNKYGYRVVKHLKEIGYSVIPVNLKEKEILGLPVVNNINQIKDNIELVIFVVQPKVVLDILKEVKRMGLKKVWLQPGSESQLAIKFCKDNNIECIYNACIIVDGMN